jgi:hypothetical protein
MTVDDVLVLIFTRLCAARREGGETADVSLAEFEQPPAIPASLLREALDILRRSGDRLIADSAPGRIRLGPSGAYRCDHGWRSFYVGPDDQRR